MSYEVDFSPIGNLAKTYNDARTKAVRERTLAELGQHFADGNIDYRGLGAKLFALGEPRSGLLALQTAEQRDARAEMLRRLNAPGALPQQAANAPQVPAPPPQAVNAMPPIPGARQSADGNWYVDDPDRPGQYLKVKP
jgi:hypothetical protein